MLSGLARPKASVCILYRKETLSSLYADMLGCEELRHPVHYVEKRWGDEDSSRFSGPCVYQLPPGFLTKHQQSVTGIFYSQ